jgi:hypothetical protein
MKIMALVAIAVAIETGARADEVTVYVQGISVVPAPVLSRAQALANDIFSAAGVGIDWRRGEPSRLESQLQRQIVVEMTTQTPRERKPGALAFAAPYEGVHIQVFYDRVQTVTEPELTPAVLAHVLVHEITHILQGTCRHSDTGVMKARWTHQDYMEMGQNPLSFTDEDVALIHSGLAARADTTRLIAAVPVSH